jgi:hypothetical protein
VREPVKHEEVKTTFRWTWECPECGRECAAWIYPKGDQQLCGTCRDKKYQKEHWEEWATQYPNLVNARLVGGIFDVWLQGIVLETEEGQRVKLEIDTGWERGEEKLVVAEED